MPKKRPAKKRPPTIKKVYYFFIIASLTIIFLVVAKVSTPPPCANSISCIKNLSGKIEEKATMGEFMKKTVSVPKIPFIAGYYPNNATLGETTNISKRIDIDLTNQKLYAFENNNLVFEFLVSTGKWGRTPTGDFKIWIKLRATRMTGGNPAIGTYYNLPNVPYTMFFYNDQTPKSRGYGIHGAYWHDNFGHPMSHGCINMKIEDSEKLYSWATPVSNGFSTYASEENPGTNIKIYGTAPYE